MVKNNQIRSVTSKATTNHFILHYGYMVKSEWLPASACFIKKRISYAQLVTKKYVCKNVQVYNEKHIRQKYQLTTVCVLLSNILLSLQLPLTR